MQTSDFINAENLIPMVNKCVRQTGTLAASSDRQKRTLHDSDFLMKQSGTDAHTLPADMFGGSACFMK